MLLLCSVLRVVGRAAVGRAREGDPKGLRTVCNRPASVRHASCAKLATVAIWAAAPSTSHLGRACASTHRFLASFLSHGHMV